MIYLGIVILVIGLIIWGASSIFGWPPGITIGRVVGLIGGVLLVVGLIIYLVAALTHGDAVEIGAWQDLVIR